MKTYNVAIVGASGAVGQELIKGLENSFSQLKNLSRSLALGVPVKRLELSIKTMKF